MTQPPAEDTREPWAFLLGVPPMDDYLTFLVQAAVGEDVDVAAAGRRWTTAASLTAHLARSEAGAADGLEGGPLPARLEEAAAQFLATPWVAASYVTSEPRIALVPLDELVIPQRQINLRFTSELASRLGDWGLESDECFKFCMAIDQGDPPISALQTGGNNFVFASRSNDARFLGARLTDAANVAGQFPGGRPTSAVVLYVGYGVNAVTVLEIEGRLVLSNGLHRLYALRASGASQAIAVVQRLGGRGELSVCPAVQQAPELYLDSPRPPLLKDYFNPGLLDTVRAPRRVREIRVQFGMSQSEAPG